MLFAGRTNLIVVEVRTDAGIFGVGEASLEGKTEAVVGAINDVSEYLVGQDPTRIEHHWQTIYRHSFWRGGMVVGSAISGIEQALWDILGKALGVPVYELLGGRVRDRVRLYANGPRGDTAEEVAESCVRIVEAGWGALKLVPFEAVPGVAGQRELREARRRMQLIRDAVGLGRRYPDRLPRASFPDGGDPDGGGAGRVRHLLLRGAGATRRPAGDG